LQQGKHGLEIRSIFSNKARQDSNRLPWRIVEPIPTVVLKNRLVKHLTKLVALFFSLCSPHKNLGYLRLWWAESGGFRTTGVGKQEFYLQVEDGGEKRIPGCSTSHCPKLLENKLKSYFFNYHTKMFVFANES